MVLIQVVWQIYLAYIENKCNCSQLEDKILPLSVESFVFKIKLKWINVSYPWNIKNSFGLPFYPKVRVLYTATEICAQRTEQKCVNKQAGTFPLICLPDLVQLASE